MYSRYNNNLNGKFLLLIKQIQMPKKGMLCVKVALEQLQQ